MGRNTNIASKNHWRTDSGLVNILETRRADVPFLTNPGSFVIERIHEKDDVTSAYRNPEKTVYPGET